MRHLLFALLLTLLAPAAWADAARLLMVRSDACHWCRAWEAEVAPAYAASPQGRAAPLQRIEIDGPWPDGIALARRPYVTPTFILIRSGAEVGRIEGYPGPDGFWQLLDGLLAVP